MRVATIKRYLPALLLYVQRRPGGREGCRNLCAYPRHMRRGCLQPDDEAGGGGTREAAQARRLPNREGGFREGADRLEGVDMMTTG